MKDEAFRLEAITFQIGEQMADIKFVADDASAKKGTHITLIMGANGTSKSRILSSIVNLFRWHRLATHSSAYRRSKDERQIDDNLTIHTLNMRRGGKRETLYALPPPEKTTLMPNRVLAIANLVRDRFIWENRHTNDFYFYLGVRQASNMTTSGALDNLVMEAFLTILSSPETTETFLAWTRNLFPNANVGFTFSEVYKRQISKFIEEPERWFKRLETSRKIDTQSVNVFRRHFRSKRSIVEALRRLLDSETLALSDSPRANQKTRTIRIDLEAIAVEERAAFADACQFASAIRIMDRPKFSIRKETWLDFDHLSSGEQNLLSTAARLIAFAQPGSFIAIDEPEVSLNVAWQQQYISLIREALVHAKGSHVVIASHSPHLVPDLLPEDATLVIVEKNNSGFLSFKSDPANFWGWGAEAVLYKVLGLPSGSNYYFSQELSAILKLVQSKSTDLVPFREFLAKCDRLDLSDSDPLRALIEEIRAYYERMARQ